MMKQHTAGLYSWEKSGARLHYITDLATAEREVSRLRPGPLGFDMEWKPMKSVGQPANLVALIQLASSKTILLIQVSAMQGIFPQKLRDILGDRKYIKAGAAIQGDCKKLWEDYQVVTRNCVDLGLLARNADSTRWEGSPYPDPLGLARLCTIYTGFSLEKDRSVQLSNWEAKLNEEQQNYAANDCHSGLKIYKKLSALISGISPKPSPDLYSFDYPLQYPLETSPSLGSCTAIGLLVLLASVLVFVAQHITRGE